MAGGLTTGGKQTKPGSKRSFALGAAGNLGPLKRKKP